VLSDHRRLQGKVHQENLFQAHPALLPGVLGREKVLAVEGEQTQCLQKQKTKHRNNKATA